MSEVLLIILLCVGVLYWQAAMRCKEVATHAARRECQLCDVQLLDQTVQQVKISMSRDTNDRWRFWREYRFEYTEDGDRRHEGHLILLGHRLVRISLETFNPVIH